MDMTFKERVERMEALTQDATMAYRRAELADSESERHGWLARARDDAKRQANLLSGFSEIDPAVECDWCHANSWALVGSTWQCGPCQERGVLTWIEDDTGVYALGAEVRINWHHLYTEARVAASRVIGEQMTEIPESMLR